MASVKLNYEDDCFCIVHNDRDVEMEINATASSWYYPQTREDPEDSGLEVTDVQITNAHYVDDNSPIDPSEIEDEVYEKLENMDYDSWCNYDEEAYEEHCCMQTDIQLGK